MKCESKIPIINEMLEMAKNNKLSTNQRKKIFEIVMNSKRTAIQKDRFIKYYNLDINSKQIYNYTKLAKEYNRTIEAIKQSIHSVIYYTLQQDETVELLEKILKEA